MNFINDNILSVVAFLPLAGAILLAFFPRRDRDVRYFALAVSIITLLASLHLTWYFVRGQGGLERGHLLEFLGAPAIEDRADGIVPSRRGAQESELGRLADDEAKLGAGRFALDRLRRLLPVILFGMAVVIPPQTYVELVSKGVTHQDYLSFWFNSYLAADQTLVRPLHKTMPTWDHLWFLVYLFVYVLSLR